MVPKRVSALVAVMVVVVMVGGGLAADHARVAAQDGDHHGPFTPGQPVDIRDWKAGDTFSYESEGETYYFRLRSVSGGVRTMEEIDAQGKLVRHVPDSRAQRLVIPNVHIRAEVRYRSTAPRGWSINLRYFKLKANGAVDSEYGTTLAGKIDQAARAEGLDSFLSAMIGSLNQGAPRGSIDGPPVPPMEVIPGVHPVRWASVQRALDGMQLPGGTVWAGDVGFHRLSFEQFAQADSDGAIARPWFAPGERFGVDTHTMTPLGDIPGLFDLSFGGLGQALPWDEEAGPPVDDGGEAAAWWHGESPLFDDLFPNHDPFLDPAFDPWWLYPQDVDPLDVFPPGWQGPTSQPYVGSDIDWGNATASLGWEGLFAWDEPLETPAGTSQGASSWSDDPWGPHSGDFHMDWAVDWWDDSQAGWDPGGWAAEEVSWWTAEDWCEVAKICPDEWIETAIADVEHELWTYSSELDAAVAPPSDLATALARANDSLHDVLVVNEERLIIDEQVWDVLDDVDRIIAELDQLQAVIDANRWVYEPGGTILPPCEGDPVTALMQMGVDLSVEVSSGVMIADLVQDAGLIDEFCALIQFTQTPFDSTLLGALGEAYHLALEGAMTQTSIGGQVAVDTSAVFEQVAGFPDPDTVVWSSAATLVSSHHAAVTWSGVQTVAEWRSMTALEALGRNVSYQSDAGETTAQILEALAADLGTVEHWPMSSVGVVHAEVVEDIDGLILDELDRNGEGLDVCDVPRVVEDTRIAARTGWSHGDATRLVVGIAGNRLVALTEPGWGYDTIDGEITALVRQRRGLLSLPAAAEWGYSVAAMCAGLPVIDGENPFGAWLHPLAPVRFTVFNRAAERTGLGDVASRDHLADHLVEQTFSWDHYERFEDLEAAVWEFLDIEGDHGAYLLGQIVFPRYSPIYRTAVCTMPSIPHLTAENSDELLHAFDQWLGSLSSPPSEAEALEQMRSLWLARMNLPHVPADLEVRDTPVEAALAELVDSTSAEPVKWLVEGSFKQPGCRAQHSGPVAPDPVESAPPLVVGPGLGADTDTELDDEPEHTGWGNHEVPDEQPYSKKDALSGRYGDVVVGD